MNTQTVLIVDDEKSNLKLLSDLLRDEVPRIILAKSGEQALAKAEEYQPDLILLDIVMPQMNGFDVITRLRQRASTSAIPVIFVSALGDVESEMQGFELGASDYIQKPFQAGLVRARVKLHLQVARQRRMLETLANIDALTSIPNRRRFSERFDVEWRACEENACDLSLVMIDIDFFKQYNDLHGHGEGDTALIRVARILENWLEANDGFIARYGGEEFIALLPGKNETQAREVMNGARFAVSALKIPHPAGKDGLLSISLGGATCVPAPGLTPDLLVSRADTCLYQAKEKGRNSMVWHTTPDQLLRVADA